FELGRMFGRPIITGLARIDGLPVALMASDPFFYGGCWTADACDKIIRFVDLAETFHLPIVYLCDCPGFHIGLDAEKSATIRKAALAVPHRRSLLERGDDRTARHPQIAGRIRRLCRKTPPARYRQLRDAPLMLQPDRRPPAGMPPGRRRS